MWIWIVVVVRVTAIRGQNRDISGQCAGYNTVSTSWVKPAGKARY